MSQRSSTLYPAVSLLAAIAVLSSPACKGDKKTTDESTSPTAKSPEPAAGPDRAKSGDKPAGDARPAAAESFEEALARGQKLAKDKKYADAIRAFETALEARPGDARTLSELSWVAFRTGQLKKARKAAEDSIAAAAKEPRLKAASLYNLGRIAEARGDVAAAKKAYTESLKLRPNRVVDRRLKSLDSPLRPQLLDGPHGDEKSFCAARLARAKGEELEDFECSLYAVDEGIEFKPKPPFLEIGRADVGRYSFQWNLAIRTSAGWFVLDEWADSDEFNEISFGSIDVDNGILSIDHSEEASERDGWEDEDGNHMSTLMQVSTTDYRTICGIGASGKVSCLPQLQTGFSSEDRKALDPSYDVELGGKGTLVIKLRDKHGTDDDVSAIVGKHKLVFP